MNILQFGYSQKVTNLLLFHGSIFIGVLRMNRNLSIILLLVLLLYILYMVVDNNDSATILYIMFCLVDLVL